VREEQQRAERDGGRHPEHDLRGYHNRQPWHERDRKTRGGDQQPRQRHKKPLGTHRFHQQPRRKCRLPLRNTAR
jgi:hypothetical protein